MTVALYLCMHTLIFSGLTWAHAHKKTSTRATHSGVVPRCQSFHGPTETFGALFLHLMLAVTLSFSLSLSGPVLFNHSVTYTHTRKHTQGHGWTRKVRWVRLRPTNRSGGKGKIAGRGQRLPQVSGFTPTPPCRTCFVLFFFTFFYCLWFFIKTAFCFPFYFLPFLMRNLVWGVWSRFRLSGRSMVDVWCSRNLLLNVTDLNREGGVEEDGGEEG